jgi:hypothetical protein
MTEIALAIGLLANAIVFVGLGGALSIAIAIITAAYMRGPRR